MSAFGKSSYSDGHANCVEISRSGETICIRDSKNPQGPTLLLTPETYRSLIARITEGTL
ncbi:DUF397 domain-containing protein [Streptomyces sp. NPDC001719]